jgi:hypothetical protein
MKSAAQLEKDVLGLPSAERIHLVLAAWESLEADPDFVADSAMDPEGMAIALERDPQVESGSARPLSHEEFLERTRGAGK